LELCCCGLFYFPCGLFEPDFRLLPQDFLLTLGNFFPLAIGSCGPSEYLVPLLGRRCCHRGPDSRSWLLVQSFDPPSYRPYGLGDPALPLAIPSAMRSFAGEPAGHSQATGTPLFELRSPPEHRPAVPSRPAGAGRHLSWAFGPFSASGSGSPRAAALPEAPRSACRV
jgi:hypothetical protein